jgi:hypothetical protein
MRIQNIIPGLFVEQTIVGQNSSVHDKSWWSFERSWIKQHVYNPTNLIQLNRSTCTICIDSKVIQGIYIFLVRMQAWCSYISLFFWIEEYSPKAKWPIPCQGCNATYILYSSLWHMFQLLSVSWLHSSYPAIIFGCERYNHIQSLSDIRDNKLWKAK